MQFVRLLAPLAVLVVVLGNIGSSPKPAFANINSISPVSSGTTITVTATYTNSPAGTPASLTAAGNGSFTAANASGGTSVQTSGIGTKEIKTTPDNSGNTGNVITITATWSCGINGPVSFLLLQVGGSPSNQSASANCTAATNANNSGGVINVTPSQQTVGQTVNVSAACQSGSVLSASPAIGSFSTAVLSGAAINAGGNSVTCTGGGQLSAVYNCAQQGATTFTLSTASGASAALTCGTGGQQSTTTSNPTTTLVNPNSAGRNSPVTISVSPENIPCGGTASIIVTASLVANASVQDGTVVNLYTTSGIIEPKQGSIKDGKFVTTLKAPMTAGPATINASVGSITNYQDVKIDCGIGAASPSVAPVAVPSIPSSVVTSPPPPPPPPAGFPTGGLPAITPPSTGDAGLKALAE